MRKAVSYSVKNTTFLEKLLCFKTCFKNIRTLDLVISLIGVHFKKKQELDKDLCTKMFFAMLCIILHILRRDDL